MGIEKREKVIEYKKKVWHQSYPSRDNCGPRISHSCAHVSQVASIGRTERIIVLTSWSTQLETSRNYGSTKQEISRSVETRASQSGWPRIWFASRHRESASVVTRLRVQYGEVRARRCVFDNLGCFPNTEMQQRLDWSHSVQRCYPFGAVHVRSSRTESLHVTYYIFHIPHKRVQVVHETIKISLESGGGTVPALKIPYSLLQFKEPQVKYHLVNPPGPRLQSIHCGEQGALYGFIVRGEEICKSCEQILHFWPERKVVVILHEIGKIALALGSQNDLSHYDQHNSNKRRCDLDCMFDHSPCIVVEISHYLAQCDRSCVYWIQYDYWESLFPACLQELSWEVGSGWSRYHLWEIYLSCCLSWNEVCCPTRIWWHLYRAPIDQKNC